MRKPSQAVVDFSRRADLLDMPFVDEHDPVGNLESFFLIVRHEDRGDVQLVMQRTKPTPKLLANLGVERAERLVEKQNARLHCECASQRDGAAAAPPKAVTGTGSPPIRVARDRAIA